MIGFVCCTHLLIVVIVFCLLVHDCFSADAVFINQDIADGLDTVACTREAIFKFDIFVYVLHAARFLRLCIEHSVALGADTVIRPRGEGFLRQVYHHEVGII